jgi:hypothetical protein
LQQNNYSRFPVILASRGSTVCESSEKCYAEIPETEHEELRELIDEDLDCLSWLQMLERGKQRTGILPIVYSICTPEGHLGISRIPLMASTTPHQLKLVTIEWKPKYKVYQERGEVIED